MSKPTLLENSSILLITICIAIFYSCTTTEPAATYDTTADATPSDTLEEKAELPDRLHILFLGDEGHHQPRERLRVIVSNFADQGIFFHYTDRQEDLNLDNLRRFDALVIYGNRTGLTSLQESDLLKYVQTGGGLVAIHSASASFNNSDAYVNLVGGAFKAHGDGTFSVKHVNPDHPVKTGVPEFQSWDETYVHMKHNPDKMVLSVRVEGEHEEPWTWVRHHGEGRVFYTAWGHDERTWSQPGFQQLLNRGIRWVAGDWALEAEFVFPEITYGEGMLPYYPPGERWGTTGDPITEVQNPLSPEESWQLIVAHPDFRVELFATEEQVINPIDLTWDEQGRLWVLETVDYPNKFTEDRTGSDRIKILEDTTGDGRADKVTTFVDGLNIPTGLVLVNGGVIVAQAPDFIFFKDTTGDGKADYREVLFSGWGTFDTHAGPSNLRYGFDNQIWGAVGYSAFEGNVGGEDHRFSSGFYRFNSDGSKLEYISNTSNNTWGLHFNEEGIVFGSTANLDVPVHSVIPNRYYDLVRGFGQKPRLPMISNSNRIFPLFEEVRQVDQHGRYTAGSGFEIYTARDFPQSYWNRKAFVSEPTGHLLGSFILEPYGSTYRAHNTWNKLASRDEWFSPIQSRVGPDGALWVLDWYNLIIQHNPTPPDFETGQGNAYINELRDQKHARIYRIVHKDAVHEQPLSLKDASPTLLVETLANDNMFWRLTAQRLLVERGSEDVTSELLELLANPVVDDLGLNPGALHSLWTLHGLGLIDDSNPDVIHAVVNSLYHPSSSVRRAALMVLPRNREILEEIIAAGFFPTREAPGEMGYTLPVMLMFNADPRVRLEALLAAAEMPQDARVGRALAEMIMAENNANDRWLRDAVMIAAARNEVEFLEQILMNSFSDNASDEFENNIASVVERVASHFALGDRPDLLVTGMLLRLESADVVIGSAFLEGLTQNWPDDKMPVLDEFLEEHLREMAQNMPVEFREKLNALADKWGYSGLFDPVVVETAVEARHAEHHVHPEPAAATPRTVPYDEGASITAANGDTLTIRSFGADLSYDVTEIRANAGDVITIRYDNTQSEMPHNVVFVFGEDDIYPVGMAALRAQHHEYIPVDDEAYTKIFGYTRLTRPGEIAYVTITVPPPGAYPYICTYPGHFTMMQGRLISQ
jgi:uncharacterized protein